MGAQEKSDAALRWLLDACKGVAEMLKTGEADRERLAYGAAQQLVRFRAEVAMPELVTLIFGLVDRVERLRTRVDELEGSVRRDNQPEA